MLGLLLTFFMSLAYQNSINAIQNDWPFRIDFILVEMENVFWNGSPATIDPGTHQVKFIVELGFTPDHILLTAPKFYLESNINRVEHRYLADQITNTGFTLLSTFYLSLHQTVLLSYMTIYSGFGIELHFLNSGVFTSSSSGVNTVYSSSLTVSDSFVDPSKYFVAAITPQLHILNFTKTNGYYAETLMSSNIINIKVKIPLTSQLQSFTLSVFVYFSQTFTSSTSSFSYYNLTCQSITGMNSTTANVSFNSNTTSNIYFIGSIISGAFKNTYSIGHYLMDTPRTPPGLYNATYVSSRADARNIIHSYIYNNVLANQFMVLIISRTACSDPNYPYLMMNKQLCYNVCPQQYYNNSNNRCNSCLDCTDIIDCDYCYYSMCNADEYYIPSNKSCKKCFDIDSNCQKCLKGMCTQCFILSQTEVLDGKCEPCADPSYFDNDTRTCKQPTSFEFEASAPYSVDNQIHAFINFNSSLAEIQNNISLKWYLNNVETQALVTYFYDNNTIKGQITIDRSMNSPTINIQVIPDDTIKFTKTQDTVTVDDIYYIHPTQQVIGQTISQATITMSQNSGIILASSSFSTFSGYIIGIFWNFQVASYYLFLPVYKPKNLFKMLNATTEILNINILPFSIPSPLDDDGTVISGKQIYDEFDIDLYFMRSHFEDIVSLILFSLFYFLLFLIFRNYSPQRFITKFIKTKIVSQVYVNVSMNFYSLITVMSFTASSALTSRKYTTRQVLFNNTTSVIGLLLAFSFTIVHPLILFIKKPSQRWDTEDCYLGLKRERKYSELVLVSLLTFQCLIPISIPLFHPMFTVTIIIISTIANTVILIQRKPLKFQVCTYYRILSQLTFVIFNLTFVAYFIIDNRFLKTDIMIRQTLGYVSIGAMALVIVLEMVEMITEMILDFYYFMKRACQNNKLIKIEQRSPSAETQSSLMRQKQKQQNRAISTLAKRRQRRASMILKSKQQIMQQVQLKLKVIKNIKKRPSVLHQRTSRKQIVQKMHSVQFQPMQENKSYEDFIYDDQDHDELQDVQKALKSTFRKSNYSTLRKKMMSDNTKNKDRQHVDTSLSERFQDFNLGQIQNL